MAFRTLKITFTNDEGESLVRYVKQEIPKTGVEQEQTVTPVPIVEPVRGSGGGSGAGNGAPPTPPVEDVFIETPFDFDDLKFDNLDFSNLDIDLNIPDIGPIGPIFAPGGASTNQGWNNGNPANNWGMGSGAGTTYPTPTLSVDPGRGYIPPPTPPPIVNVGGTIPLPAPPTVKLSGGKAPIRISSGGGAGKTPTQLKDVNAPIILRTLR